jgi:hypothetical protein
MSESVWSCIDSCNWTGYLNCLFHLASWCGSEANMVMGWQGHHYGNGPLH